MRDTTEAAIGAITGTLTRPQLLVSGRRLTGRLCAAGRTTTMRPEQEQPRLNYRSRPSPLSPAIEAVADTLRVLQPHSGAVLASVGLPPDGITPRQGPLPGAIPGGSSSRASGWARGLGHATPPGG
ncbi:hypothetical protein [Streptomyces goshikiensis]|uniref:hypothetical protein n=1 Tax=Streptomyces goshikiensis TaxID=1942 RepID=UPI0033E116DC